jgi:hypothetical protein
MVQTRSSQRAAEEDDGSPSPSAYPFDDVFHKGVAISMWQNSGDADSNWTNFVKSKLPFKRLPIGINRFSGKYNITDNVPNTWDRCVVREGGLGGAGLTTTRGGGGGGQLHLTITHTRAHANTPRH